MSATHAAQKRLESSLLALRPLKGSEPVDLAASLAFLARSVDEIAPNSCRKAYLAMFTKAKAMNKRGLTADPHLDSWLYGDPHADHRIS